MDNRNNGTTPTKRSRHVCIGAHDTNKELHPYTIMTTGQVAKACQVAPRTVSVWCDKGELKCYHIPLSRDRRIYLSDFIAFCIKHGMHTPPKYLPTRVVSYGVDKNELPEYVNCIDNSIELGMYLATYNIRVGVIGDSEGIGYATVATHTILSLHPVSRVVLVVHEDIDANPLKSMDIKREDYHRVIVIKRPLQQDAIINAIGIDPENRVIS